MNKKQIIALGITFVIFFVGFSLLGGWRLWLCNALLAFLVGSLVAAAFEEYTPEEEERIGKITL